MLWTVEHLWVSGARFVFNCYCHWSFFLLLNRNSMANFLHSTVSMAQGDPLATVSYGIGTLPLIKYLKQDIAEVIQHWYDGNVRALYVCS